MKGIKESDLLIVSKIDLELTDIKKIITVDWLLKTLVGGTSIMVYVSEKLRKGPLTLRVDVEFGKAF